MKVGGKQKWAVLLMLPILVACGSKTIAEAPVAAEEVTEAESEGSKVKFESFAGASPQTNETKETETVAVEGSATEIEWIDFETAIDRNKENKKFIFIDMYTDWCGWCKKMDASTFTKPDVINYIDQNFYAVKMNPESKEAVAYKEVLYEQKAYGKKFYNELAVNLMAGKMTFPSFVILNKREIKRGVITGYQTETQLLSTLRHYVE